ncbi:MAG: response regulator [Hyphomicrobiales bacterium]
MTDESPPRVLLVEDEALIAMMIEDQLTQLGFEVVGPAATASQAIALCEDCDIDGAVLDINLGAGQRSDPIAEHLYEHGIPFVFVTGYGQAGVDERFADASVLQKPFTLPQLRQLLAEMF